MSVTRGKFLQALGKSLPGMLLGTVPAVAAQKLLAKMAAASGAAEIFAPEKLSAAKPLAPKPALDDIIRSGPAHDNCIALTFDDGPTPGVTDRILDELKQRGLFATFFMIGERVVDAPDLARRVVAEGHEVANHTFSHAKLSDLPNARAVREIQQAQDIFADALGHRPVWFRPPFGELRPDQTRLVHDLNLRIVLWNVNPGDWAQPGEDKIISTVLRDTKAGSIIVCHDRYTQNANATGPMLDGLLERGYRSVTLSTLMSH